jgi:Sigma-70, region 4
MDEVKEFCVRMLGAGDDADLAADRARRCGSTERVEVLTAAVAACRQVKGPGDGAGPAAAEPEADRRGEVGLVSAVAGELAAATARLPQRQREALALRERFGFSYAEMGRAIGVEPTAVAPLLARARLGLRSQLRGTEPPTGECPERDRALRTIVRRRDGEEVTAADEDWLIDHLGHCTTCAGSHLAMLEASACYRAWQLPESERETAAGADPSGPAST